MRRRIPNRSTRSQLARAALILLAIALGSIAIACRQEEPATPEPAATPSEPAPAAPPATAPPAAAPPAAATPGAADEEIGEPLISEGVIPEGFPKDVPIYPGVKIGSSISGPGPEVFVILDTDDAPDTIVTHYRTELAKNGWSVVDTAPGDGLDGTKGNRELQVRARRNEENRTEIALLVSGS